MRNLLFIPKKSIAFFLQVKSYDAVIREVNGEPTQWYSDLPETDTDIKHFLQMTGAYGIDSNEKNDKYKIVDPKSIKQV